jgi:hypothetical protein
VTGLGHRRRTRHPNVSMNLRQIVFYAFCRDPRADEGKSGSLLITNIVFRWPTVHSKGVVRRHDRRSRI